MTIRLARPHPRADALHRLGQRTEDPRVWFTVCGIRFAFGDVGRRVGQLRECGACWL